MISNTKERILVIAGDLFARKGYTATTIADIARALGTTTAALYYHFPSKSEILGALLAEPLAAYNRLVEDLDSSSATPEELLGAFVDLTVASRALGSVVDRDPSVLAKIDQHLPRKSVQVTAQAIAVLAGPEPDRAAMIRASAALSLIKGATQAALADDGTGTPVCDEAPLCDSDRAEIINAALRALSPT